MKQIAAFLWIVLCSQALLAQDIAQEKVDRFFSELMDYKNQDIETLFAESFINQVPAATLEQYLKIFEEKYGNFVKAEIKEGRNLTIHYSRATMPGIIGFDDQGKVNTLWFGQPKMKEDSFDKIRAELESMTDEVSVCVTKNDQPIFEINPDQPLAIGSAFKLYVLQALKAKIENGEMNWDDIILLDPAHQSLPSGILQNWPAQTPLTVRTVANLMISISDNTATDILIARLGRDYIEKFAPETMRPFLTTLEMFKLKYAGTIRYARKYAKANLAARREMLREIKVMDKSRVKEENVLSPSYVKEIEWLASTRQLCGAIASLRDCESISINQGLANKDDWQSVGFKGGSEPGVLNYTHVLTGADGSVYAVSATVNNEEKIVDENKEFTLVVTRIIDLLAAEK
ncbi:MAG: serine hydrolase [Candidatus Kapaibacterium sp.]